MDGEEADGIGSFFLRDCVALGGPDRLLFRDEADEPLDVGTAELLVRAREACELAQVGITTLTVAPRENGQVIVVLDQDALAEELERELGGGVDEPLVPLQKRPDEPSVVLSEIRRQRPLEALEDRAPLGGGANENERVVRDADEGRGENGQERLVVVAVLEQPQVVEQVDDLLLAEVSAPRHPDRRQVDGPKLLLEPLRVRPCGKQEHDLARGGDARIDEFPHPSRDMTCLCSTPVEPRRRIRRLVGDEQLERCPECRVPVALGRGQRLEAVAELLSEQLVDGGEDLGA